MAHARAWCAFSLCFFPPSPSKALQECPGFAEAFRASGGAVPDDIAGRFAVEFDELLEVQTTRSQSALEFD